MAPHEIAQEPAAAAESGADEYSLSAYSYSVPEDLIAQAPLPNRSAARLMLLGAHSGVRGLSWVERLAELLPPKTLLIGNNTRVFPARLPGLREGGGKAEFLLLTPVPFIQAEKTDPSGHFHAARVKWLLKPARKLKPGSWIHIAPGLRVLVTESGAFGHAEA